MPKLVFQPKALLDYLPLLNVHIHMCTHIHNLEEILFFIMCIKTEGRAFLPKIKMDLLSDYVIKPLIYFISSFEHVKNAKIIYK